MTRVLVTGASGFVGHTLCQTLSEAGWTVRAALRRTTSVAAPEQTLVGEITGRTQWAQALAGTDCVVHLAAQAHILQRSRQARARYHETNAEGTRCLARAAAAHGVRRFVYLSTVKVNGERSGARPFTAADAPHPEDAYAHSKWLGERYLDEAAAGTAMQAVIVRAPLVYGPGVRANFLRLMRWVDHEWPLPFGAARNRRSLVSVWNLSELLLLLLRYPGPAAGTWMVSDGEDLSTPELLRRLAQAMGRRAHLLSVPVPMVLAAGALLGQAAALRRLCTSLAVDVTATRARFAWAPALSVDEALARTVAWYRTGRRQDAGQP
jgi:UDP-glucose 4-epimerase